jgi:hypothetical protein
MDISETVITGQSGAETDIEKGQLNRSPEPSTTPKPSPATTSSTAFSQNKSDMASSRSHWDTQIRFSFCNLHLLGLSKSYPLVKRFWSCISRSASAEENEESNDSENIIRSCKRSLHTQLLSKINQIVESCPEGYPQIAAFLDSDENFMLYRRFGYLQSRILLHKQDQLRALEERLDRLDQADNNDEKTRRYLKSRDLDDKRNGPRTTLLETIETKFKEYGALYIN